MLAGALVPLLAIAVRGVRGELGANPIARGAEPARARGARAAARVARLHAARRCSSDGRGRSASVACSGSSRFFYAALHVATYTGIDQLFDWPAIWKDVTKRKFIFVGFAAFVLLIPLALTSTDAAVRRLGFARWKQLHRLAYVAPALGVLHFFWRVKKDVSEPLTYGAVLAALLAIRVVAYVRAPARRASPAHSPEAARMRGR